MQWDIGSNLQTFSFILQLVTVLYCQNRDTMYNFCSYCLYLEFVLRNRLRPISIHHLHQYQIWLHARRVHRGRKRAEEIEPLYRFLWTSVHDTNYVVNKHRRRLFRPFLTEFFLLKFCFIFLISIYIKYNFLYQYV